MKFKKLKKGFTLVELVVVIAVIAILAAVSVGAYFGVTDSANSSNATATLKQIKDLWIMYSADEYDDFKTMEDRAKDFCLRYVVDMGPSTYVNYDMVSISEKGATSNRIQYANGSEASTEAILFKIETNYPTWFVVNQQYIVEESSTVLKSNAEFNNSLLASTRILHDESVRNGIAENAETYSYPFKIQILGVDEKGDDVRGFPYYRVDFKYIDQRKEVHPSTITMVPGEKLADKDHRLILSKSVSIQGAESQLMYNVYLGDDKTQLVETSEELYLESKEVISRVDDAVATDKYGFYINKPYAVTSEVILSVDVNLDNYPVCLIQKSASSSLTTFATDMDEIIRLMPVDTPDGTQNFIFVSDYTIDKPYNIPDNTVFVVDYLVDIDAIENYAVSNMTVNRFRSLDVTDTRRIDTWKVEAPLVYNNIDNICRPGEEVADAAVNPNPLVINTVTITENGVLNIKDNSYISVEGFIYGANSNTKIAIRDRGEIINNGKINISNSYFRTLGEVLGEGSIEVENSLFVEIFKPHDYKGGSFTANSIAQTNTSNGVKRPIFPFIDFQFDNLKCETNFNHGSSLEAITVLDLFGIFVPDPIGILSSQENSNISSLFKTISSKNENGEELTKLVKTYDSLNRRSTFAIHGKVTDSEFRVKLDVERMMMNLAGDTIGKYMSYVVGDVFNNGVISSKDYNFPINNLNVNVTQGSTLVLDEKNAIYDLLPSAQLNVEGTLIIGDEPGNASNKANTKLNVVNKKECQNILNGTYYDTNAVVETEETLSRTVQLTRTYLNGNVHIVRQAQTRVKTGSSWGRPVYSDWANSGEATFIREEARITWVPTDNHFDEYNKYSTLNKYNLDNTVDPYLIKLGSEGLLNITNGGIYGSSITGNSSSYDDYSIEVFNSESIINNTKSDSTSTMKMCLYSEPSKLDLNYSFWLIVTIDIDSVLSAIDKSGVNYGFVHTLSPIIIG